MLILCTPLHFITLLYTSTSNSISFYNALSSFITGTSSIPPSTHIWPLEKFTNAFNKMIQSVLPSMALFCLIHLNVNLVWNNGWTVHSILIHVRHRWDKVFFCLTSHHRNCRRSLYCWIYNRILQESIVWYLANLK
jgi:hypothetical protein